MDSDGEKRWSVVVICETFKINWQIPHERRYDTPFHGPTTPLERKNSSCNVHNRQNTCFVNSAQKFSNVLKNRSEGVSTHANYK